MNPSEEYLCFHSYLGLAISQWATLESALCRVMLCCVKQSDRSAVGAAFFGIESFRSKLRFADRMITSVFTDKSKLAEWEIISERALEVSQLRNKLAHWQVTLYMDLPAGQQYRLVPFVSEKPKRATKNPKPPAGSLAVRDVIGVLYQIAAVRTALHRFEFSSAGLDEQLPEFDLQGARPPTIRQLRTQIHALLGYKLQSRREKLREEDAKNAAASLEPPIAK